MSPPRHDKLPPRASDIFVNRDGPIKFFEDAAVAIPADGAIIRVFHVIGGQGKTALCRKLFRATDPNSEPSLRFSQAEYSNLITVAVALTDGYWLVGYESPRATTAPLRTTLPTATSGHRFEGPA